MEVVSDPAVEIIEGEDDLALRKGKRRAEDAPETLSEVTDMEVAPEQKQKRQKRTERVPSEIKVRPVRERRQSSYSLARGFLDDKDFETMEKQYSKQEARRAAFYDTSSYTGEIASSWSFVKMSSQEREAFPVVLKSPRSTNLYLFHRNSILALANAALPRHVTFSDYEAHLNTNKHRRAPKELHLMQRIWKFLHVNGRINKDKTSSELFEASSPYDSDSDYPSADAIDPLFESAPRKTVSYGPNIQFPQNYFTPEIMALRQQLLIETVALTQGGASLSANGHHLPSSSSHDHHTTPKHKTGRQESKNGNHASSTHASSASSQSSSQSSSRSHMYNTHSNGSEGAHGATDEKFKKPHPQRASQLAHPQPKAAGYNNSQAHLNSSAHGQHKADNHTSPGSDTHTSGTSSPSSQHLQVPNNKPVGRPRSPKRQKKDEELLPAIPRTSVLPPRAESAPSSDIRVCIVGAGIAGLAAAQCLHQHGIRNVVVLESRLRIGGRIYTINVNGTPMELGAQFIQDSEANPVKDLCSQLQLPILPLSTSLDQFGLADMFFKPTEKKVDPSLPTNTEIPETSKMDVSEPAPTLLESNVTEQASEHQSTNGDTGAVNEKFVATQEKHLLYHFGASEAGISAGELKRMHDYTENYCVVQGGLSELTRNMALGLDIRLGCKVDLLNWNREYRSDSVLVRYSDAQGETRSDSFDVVIVTVPLGVLKSSSIKFFPPLPDDKLLAIEHVRVGHQNKAIVMFERAFWKDVKIQDTSSDPQSVATNDKTSSSEHPSILTPEGSTVIWSEPSLGIFALAGDFLAGKDVPALQIIWCGDTALTMGSVEPNVCLGAIISKLKLAFGAETVPVVSAFAWAPWSADPHCLGAHSFVPATMPETTRVPFAYPTDSGRICFAGEHTHLEHPATIHGAYESGIREARRILESFTDRKPGELTFPFNQSLEQNAIETFQHAQIDFKFPEKKETEAAAGEDTPSLVTVKTEIVSETSSVTEQCTSSAMDTTSEINPAHAQLTEHVPAVTIEHPEISVQ